MSKQKKKEKLVLCLCRIAQINRCCANESRRKQFRTCKENDQLIDHAPVLVLFLNSSAATPHGIDALL